MSKTLQFTSVLHAEPIIKRQIAFAVFHLDFGFYSILFEDENTAIEKIMIALDEAGGDLGCGFVAYEENKPIGYLSYFPISQKSTRNLVTLKSCIDLSSSVSKSKLKLASLFNQQLAPIPSEACYLNKIIVFPENRGLSYGTLLLQFFLQKSQELDLFPIFHVKRDNSNAIRFYQKNEFYTEESNYEYLLCKLK